MINPSVLNKYLWKKTQKFSNKKSLKKHLMRIRIQHLLVKIMKFQIIQHWYKKHYLLTGNKYHRTEPKWFLNQIKKASKAYSIKLNYRVYKLIQTKNIKLEKRWIKIKLKSLNKRVMSLLKRRNIWKWVLIKMMWKAALKRLEKKYHKLNWSKL